ncbi:uncharacterized protein LOC105382154 [Plutella xylostella]|uniref:uncharacterized protein LOC105382154 n=1 Tax=Plutella xylostella TaxID=51655 RepID=UPI002032EB7D|nr:uncharacterized protein LOC105382154 [Plutella xylostella]
MTTHCWIAVTVLLAGVFLTGVQTRPSENNEEWRPVYIPEEPNNAETSLTEDSNVAEGRSISYDTNEPATQETTQEIIEKIRKLNDGLNRPHRQKPKYNNNEPDKSHGLDEETLKRLQLLINFAPQLLSNHQESTKLRADIDKNVLRNGKPKALYGTPLNALAAPNTVAYVPYQYTALGLQAVAAQSHPNDISGNRFVITNNDLNTIDNTHSTRQGLGSLPFNIQWPLAPLFPVLLRDPFITFLQNGNLDNLFEYGQSADVCRKQKSSEGATEDNAEEKGVNETLDDKEKENKIKLISTLKRLVRQGRAIKTLKKRNIVTAAPRQELNTKVTKASKKIFGTKKPVSKKPLVVHPSYQDQDDEDNTAPGFDSGDLRNPFTNDYTWFGNRKPVAPSPGFFINRLRVRKGGVAIAGPGGVATAGRGGTAIVGPGGLAYTQPGGMAVAGPAAKIYALSPETDLTQIIAQLQKKANKDGTSPRSHTIPEGKLVATGPVIYYHELKQSTNVCCFWLVRYEGRLRRGRLGGGFRRLSDADGAADRFAFGPNSDLSKKDSMFSIVVGPVAHAVSGDAAIATPVSRVWARRGAAGTVLHAPRASAIAGPGGIAHAQSDLARTEYLPFYGGGKGQYLEVTKNQQGQVVNEKIVNEDNISNENIVKNRDETLLSRVLNVNLQNLKALSTNLLRLHNLGRTTGSLKRSDKRVFKEQLMSLGEISSNLAKLVDEIGDDVDMLFKRNNVTQKRQYDDDVGEEGVGIDSPGDSVINLEELGEILNGATIADAQPVGLAVIGESGLAASRPMATAVALTGVALARPVATAIAGIDPAALNLDLHLKGNKKQG